MEGIKDAELVMVFTIFRHGARAPMWLPPYDPNKNVLLDETENLNNNIWPDGLGNLTNEGKRQAYELGVAYRQKYDGFLSSDYKRKELYVYSTDVDRTLMSAQCCLAGMYPPKENQLWNANLPWQPIPVHTNSVENDPYVSEIRELYELPSGGTKPRHIEIYDHFNTKYKDEWDRWMKVCNPDDPNNKEAFMALDAIFIEKEAGLPYFVPPNSNLALIGFLLMERVEQFLELAPGAMKVGRALLNAFLTAIDGHIDGTNKTKMYMYSEHDLYIMSVMNQLHIGKVERPGYCGHCTFELYKNRANDTYYVKLLFRKDHNEKLVEVPLDKNLPYLSLAAFQQLVKASQ